ncbi:MAG TPA: type II toxin-antitoxin system ParD family antitoxin, partial [Oscillatoriaceae cyanobacterium]
MAVKTMNVSLSDELASYVEGQVGTGYYTSNSELVREAIREHKERRAVRARAVAQVDADLEAGLAAL